MELEYETHERPPDQIVFLVDEQRYLLAFPLNPRWVRLTGIIGPFAWGAAQIAVGVYFGWMLQSMNVLLRAPRFALAPMLIFFAGGIILMLYSGLLFRSYRRFGHLSRRLYIDESASALGERREGKERWREWRQSAIKTARVSRLRNVLGRQVGGVLSIRLRCWPYWIAARCRQKELPQFQRFADELARQIPGRVTILGPSGAGLC